MPHLFEPLTLRGVTIRNRIGISPMCQYSAEDGVPNDWHMVHLGARASGGAGIVIVEATGVEPRGRISPNDLGLWNDEQAAAFAPIVRFIKGQGATAGIQIGHAGRKASTARIWDGGAPLTPENGGWQPIAPSPIPFSDRHATPTEMTEADIAEVQQAFVDAASRADAAGFDVVEIHGAHGYLVNSFLSPLTNTRTDRYGGSFENRVRFLLETTRGVRNVWPDGKPLFVRLSATDWLADGWTLDDSVELAKLLKAEGVDLVDCSSGGAIATADVPAGPGYQVPLASGVRHGAGIATAAVGMISDPAQADQIIRNGEADLVLIGRASLRNPSWPLHAAIALGDRKMADWPNQYGRA